MAEQIANLNIQEDVLSLRIENKALREAVAELKGQIEKLQQDIKHKKIAIQSRKARIKDLEKQIKKMKQDLDNARESANKQEQWEIYSVLNDIYNDNFEVITSISN